MNTLDAHTLTTWQHCKRRWLLVQDGYPHDLRWHPKSLFDSVMRRAVFALSSGQQYEDVACAARTQFIDASRSPGLNVQNCDVFKLAMDYCSIITNVLYALSCVSLPVLRIREDVDMVQGVRWHFLANQDDSGTLHRWVFVDAWDDERFTSEMHSWYVFGDVAAAPAPMQLHVVSIGQRRDGRMTTPWSRAHRHPAIAGRFKFEKIQGQQWTPMFFADHRITSEEWVTQMQREGLTQTLIQHFNIAEPKPEHIESFKQQVLRESADMQRVTETVSDALLLPMSRSACDFPRACPFLDVCYQ